MVVTHTLHGDLTLESTPTFTMTHEQPPGPRGRCPLASVGLYGVITHVVGQRTPELAVRMALGATKSEVQRMILRKALLFSALGATIGSVCRMRRHARLRVFCTTSAHLTGCRSAAPRGLSSLSAPLQRSGRRCARHSYNRPPFFAPAEVPLCASDN